MMSKERKIKNKKYQSKQKKGTDVGKVFQKY